MKLPTKTTRRKDRGLIVLSWINRAQVLSALFIALPVCGHAAAQSRINFATNRSFAHPPAIKENFIAVERPGVRHIESGSGPTIVMIHGKDTGHEIPQTHPESIYNALSLITSPKRVSDVSTDEVHSLVREISSRYVLLDRPYEFGKLKPSAFEDDRSDQSINHQLTLQRRISE